MAGCRGGRGDRAWELVVACAMEPSLGLVSAAVELVLALSSMASTHLCSTYCSLHGARLCCRICLLSYEGGMSSEWDGVGGAM
eukprot:4791011-Alexandrium_andersonii.AAC.1